jgi:hypothetical protein
MKNEDQKRLLLDRWSQERERERESESERELY